MAQGGNSLRLALKTSAELFFPRQIRWQQFDGNRAIERRMVAFIDLAHRAPPDYPLNLVRAERLTGQYARIGNWRQREGQLVEAHFEMKEAMVYQTLQSAA